jgi:hypothetical protein
MWQWGRLVTLCIFCWPLCWAVMVARANYYKVTGGSTVIKKKPRIKIKKRLHVPKV